MQLSAKALNWIPSTTKPTKNLCLLKNRVNKILLVSYEIMFGVYQIDSCSFSKFQEITS